MAMWWVREPTLPMSCVGWVLEPTIAIVTEYPLNGSIRVRLEPTGTDHAITRSTISRNASPPPPISSAKYTIVSTFPT